MTLPFKLAVVMINIAAALFIALDPAVQVAYIAMATSVITGTVAIVLGVMNRKIAKETKEGVVRVEVNVDGVLSKIRAEKAEQSVQLADTQKSLSHAEGKAEGIQGERDR